jgi:hypothetical protein
MNRKLFILGVAPITCVLLTSCELSRQEELDCTTQKSGTTRGVIISGPTSELVTQDLVVRGSAEHSEGLAIRRVLVAGVAATNQGFNFDSWSATLPVATLAGLPVDEDGRVTVKAIAEDACLHRSELASFPLRVDPNPSVRVDQLTLTITYPSGENLLPADGHTPAVVTVQANPEAMNATVMLSTQNGSFQGTSGGTVVLTGDRKSPASTHVLYTSTVPGTFVLTAESKGRMATTSVQVVGPPTLAPNAASLSPGQKTRITVFSGAPVKECQATPSTGLTVTSGDINLMATPGASDTNGDERVDFEVAAADDLAAAAATTVTCRDVFGQTVSGVFSASP